jgi:transcriptional regulator with XRE-family HTH domain
MPPHSPHQPQPGLGAVVRELREGAGLTQRELGARSGLDPSWISRIERGRADPTWGDVRRIAAALETSIDEIAERAEGG